MIGLVQVESLTIHRLPPSVVLGEMIGLVQVEA
jgi:hypothetical protein